jgi:CubicO group peptidase (beta-lactamase class C family)
MVVVASIVVTAACTPTSAPDAEKAEHTGTPAAASAMTDYLDGLVRSRLFRGTVEVRRGNQVLLRKGFDDADFNAGVPNGPATRFRLASVTKQFTALAVLILQNKHLLRVDDRVCVHLPDCPPAWRAITIDQLLTHTSGLFDYNDLTEAEGQRYLREFGDTPTPQQLLTVFANRPLHFRPGTKWDYSNCGYDLLGILIERLSGHPYGQSCARRSSTRSPWPTADTTPQPEPTAARPRTPSATPTGRIGRRRCPTRSTTPAAACTPPPTT